MYILKVVGVSATERSKIEKATSYFHLCKIINKNTFKNSQFTYFREDNSLFLKSDYPLEIQKQEVLGRTNRLFSFDTSRTSYKSYCCVFADTITLFTEPLPSNIHIQTL
jgi:hypothetical protein